MPLQPEFATAVSLPGLRRSALRGVIARHPLAAFVGLAYLVSWSCWIPFAVRGDTFRQGVGWPTQMLGLMGPLVAAVIVTGVADGREGLHRLWRSIIRWRIGWHLPMFFALESFKDFTAVEIVGWVIGLTAGSILLTWMFRGSRGSVLLVAVWHTVFNFTSGATPTGSGAVAAITSTLVMIAAVLIVIADRRSRDRHLPSSAYSS